MSGMIPKGTEVEAPNVIQIYYGNKLIREKPPKVRRVERSKLFGLWTWIDYYIEFENVTIGPLTINEMCDVIGFYYK